MKTKERVENGKSYVFVVAIQRGIRPKGWSQYTGIGLEDQGKFAVLQYEVPDVECGCKKLPDGRRRGIEYKYAPLTSHKLKTPGSPKPSVIEHSEIIHGDPATNALWWAVCPSKKLVTVKKTIKVAKQFILGTKDEWDSLPHRRCGSGYFVIDFDSAQRAMI